MILPGPLLAVEMCCDDDDAADAADAARAAYDAMLHDCQPTDDTEPPFIPQLIYVPGQHYPMDSASDDLTAAQAAAPVKGKS